MKGKFRLLLLSAALLGAAVPVIALTTPGAGAATTTTSTTTTSNTTTSTTASYTIPLTAPVVKTEPASKVTANSATLSGTVNRDNQATSCYFEYGPTTSYGMQTPAQAVPTTASGTQTIGASVSRLEARTSFHYRIVCANQTGTTAGGDVGFTTTDHGPSQIRLSGHTGFVSSSGTAGVFIGCYGDRNCAGWLRVLRNGKTIGYRSYYFVAANSGGIVHVPITPAALSHLKQVGSYKVTIASTTTGGQKLQPGDKGFTVTFHVFH